MTNKLPKKCRWCQSVKWNDDYTGGFEMPAPIIATSAPVKTSDSTTSDVNDWLERMRAKKGNPPPIGVVAQTKAAWDAIDGDRRMTELTQESVPSLDEWQGWSEERRTVENGDVITYRQHLKTGKVKEIARESDLATA